MKKLLLFILLFFIIIFVGYQFLLNSSIGSHPIDNIETLLIDEDILLKGWRFDYIKPITGDYEWGIENRSVHFVFKTEQGSAIQYVYRFRNIYESMYAYYFLKRDLLLVKKSKLSFITYHSQIANDWDFGCEKINVNDVMCNALGRYEDYIVYFLIAADKEGLTPDQLGKILQNVDDRMQTFLKK
jgi:hypothetical protein